MLTRTRLLGLMAIVPLVIGATCPDSPTDPEDTDPGTINHQLDAQVAANCAADGLEDYIEVVKGYMTVTERLNLPTVTLPMGVGYNPTTGAFNFPVDLNDDGLNAEGTLHGVARPGLNTDLSNGLQQGEAVGARWSITDGVSEVARGAFGLGKLGLTAARLTITQIQHIDTTVTPPDTTLFGEPTFQLPGACQPFVVHNFQVMISPVPTNPIATADPELPAVTLGFATAVAGSPDTLDVFILKEEGQTVASGTATFRERTFEVEVDFGSGTITIGPEIS